MYRGVCIAGKPAPTEKQIQFSSGSGSGSGSGFVFDFDLKRPVKHAGRNSAGIWGVNRQGCRFSRPAPWMARGGGPPNHCRITGTPSLGEVPSVGARALWLLSRFSKVTRRKGGTLSGRYPNNGYAPPPTPTLFAQRTAAPPHFPLYSPAFKSSPTSAARHGNQPDP